jgi:hypothetical protein
VTALDLSLHKKQGLALLSEATEIGYGGAAGGGKSHLGRVSAIFFCVNIPGLQVYLFRRQHNELVKNHMEGPTSFPAMLHAWVKAGFCRIVKDEIRFWNGSKIFLCHCQHEKDVFNWLGPEMHYLIIEQAEQFTPFMLQMLRGRNRIPEALEIPEQYRKLFPRVLYTFNPGGVGHAYFKSKFVKALKRDSAGVSEIVEQPDEEGGKLRQFIQAKLDDNPSVNPIEYRKTLRGLPPRMAKALEEGDFDQVVGAFFPEIDRSLHLIKPFRIPDHWTRIMSMDWGACGEGDPFSIGWWAVSDGVNTPYPRNSLICYKIWYGAGLPKVTASQVAQGILKREANEPEPIIRVAGGDIEDKRGHGPSIFEIFAEEGVHFTRADQRRQPGHVQMRERLVGKNDKPMIYWFEQFEDILETIMNLQHDLNDPNDCTQHDDHCLHGDTSIQTKDGIRKIKELVGTKGHVKNHLGEWVPYWNCKSYGIDKMIKLTFSDGTELSCTPDHKIMSSKEEWIKALDFKNQSRYAYKSWKQSSLQQLAKSSTDSDITYLANITPGHLRRQRAKDYIEKFGCITKGIFQKVFISIIKTTIETITKLKTWNAYQDPSTTRFICPRQKTESIVESRLKRSDTLRQIGIEARRVGLWLREIITNISLAKRCCQLKNMLVSNVASLIPQEALALCFVNSNARQNGEGIAESMISSGSAPSVSSHSRIIDIVKLRHAAENADVLKAQTKDAVCLKIEEIEASESFCLDTPYPHSFLTKDNISVHNCAEMTRYGCMVRPWVIDMPVEDMQFEEKFKMPTMDELWRITEQNRGYRR